MDIEWYNDPSLLSEIGEMQLERLKAFVARGVEELLAKYDGIQKPNFPDNHQD